MIERRWQLVSKYGNTSCEARKKRAKACQSGTGAINGTGAKQHTGDILMPHSPPWKTMKSCPIKTMKTCFSLCETSATRQSLRKLRRERIRKGRAPAGFASKPLQECSLNENVPQPLRGSATRQNVRKLRRERIRKGRAQADFASKPLQECNLKNLETLLLEP